MGAVGPNRTTELATVASRQIDFLGVSDTVRDRDRHLAVKCSAERINRQTRTGLIGLRQGPSEQC